MAHRLICVLTACVLMATATAQSSIYNASVEFSASANPQPGGVWSYGLRPAAPGTFELFPHAQVIDGIDFWDRDLPYPAAYPKVGHNGTAQTQFWGGAGEPVAPGETIMHPGLDAPAVLRFTAPSAGTYSVVVQSRATSSCSSATTVSLWAGVTQLDAGGLGGTGSQLSLEGVVYRLEGETIDLLVGNGGNGINCDHVGVSFVIAVLGCGPADVGQAGGLPGFDGQLDNNDFIVFIGYFFASDPIADCGSAGGEPGSDGSFDNNDFVVFIDRFFDGC